MKLIVFDLFAPLGHFKMPYTTTSPLTFPVPPKTAVYGILGAIIGLDKKEYLTYFQKEECSIAIKLNNPIQKYYLSENLINTKNVNMFSRMNSRKHAPHTQIRIEFLKNPSYRLFVNFKNIEYFKKLQNYLLEHKSEYTISLGLSECIANFLYIGTFKSDMQKNITDFKEVSTIVPLKYILNNSDINLMEEGKSYQKIHLPLEMLSDRELIETDDFIMESNGYKISAKLSEFYYIEELNEYLALF